MLNMNETGTAPQPAMQQLITKLEQVSEWTGRAVAWLTLAMVIAMFAIVIMRYLFNLNSIAVQESITYMHAIVFMLGAAYTLKHDGHVRVDIFYRRMHKIRRAWVDLLGTLFLLFPVCLFILFDSWTYVAKSWQLLEGSSEAGGLPFVYLLKSTILLLPVLLMAQGLAFALRNLLVIKHRHVAGSMHEIEEL